MRYLIDAHTNDGNAVAHFTVTDEDPAQSVHVYLYRSSKGGELTLTISATDNHEAINVNVESVRLGESPQRIRIEPVTSRLRKAVSF